MRVLVRAFLVALFPIVALSGIGVAAVAVPEGAAGHTASATVSEGARAQPGDQQVCVVSGEHGQRCYDTVAAFRRAESLSDNKSRERGQRETDCPWDYLCLYSDDGWDDPLVFIHQSHAGVYKLPDWARDSASTQQNNVGCATAVDYDWPFNHTTFIYSATSSEFWTEPHPKGTWDNRIDEVVMDCG